MTAIYNFVKIKSNENEGVIPLNKFKKLVSLIVTLLLVLTSCVWAEEVPSLGMDLPKVGTIETQDGSDIVTFIVELEGGGVLEQIEALGTRAVSDILKNNILKNISYSQKSAINRVKSTTNLNVTSKFTHILNGFTVKARRDMLSDLENIDGVENVYISEDRYVIHSDGEELKNWLRQDKEVGLDKLNSTYTGKGVVVGVIDSELQISHSAFSTVPETQSLTYEKVQKALAQYDFSAETRKSGITVDSVYKSGKIPFCFDYGNNDTNPSTSSTVNYHGTHVTGIIAGNSDEFQGVAPDAQIVFMKGSADGAKSFSDANLIAALDDLVKLDVDVINMSLGSDSGPSDSSRFNYNEVYSRIEDAGIAIVASAGNSGRMGEKTSFGAPLASQPDYGLVGSPSTHSHATSVASLAIPPMVERFYLGEDISQPIGYSDSSLNYLNSSFREILSGQTLDYLYCGYGTEDEVTDEASGKIVLVDRGFLSFADKVSNAEAKGALGVIVVNTENNLINIAEISSKIPAVAVTATSGTKMKNATTKKIKIPSETNLTEADIPKSMATSSSWGVTPDLKLKPEVTAVGGNVYSAAYNNGYAYMSGTSMAAPQCTGAHAVVLEYINKEINSSLNKSTKNSYARRLLHSTAVPFENASPRQQGAGVINVSNAINSPVMIYRADGKTKVELGDNLENISPITFKAYNFGNTAYTYTLSGTVLTDNYYLNGDSVALVSDTQVLDGAKITFNSNTVTINSGQEVEITASLDLTGVDKESIKEIFTNGFFVDGFINMTPSVDTIPELSIPFMGFCGDWTDAPTFGTGSIYDESTDVYTSMSGIMGVIGSNVYKLNAVSEDDGSIKVLYSPNSGINQLLLNVDNKRNLANLTATLKNEDGEIVKTVSKGAYLRKNTDGNLGNYKLFTLTDNSGNIFEDGTYTVDVSAGLDFDNSPEINKTFQVVLDTKLPTLVDAFIINNGSDILLYAKVTDESSGRANLYYENAAVSALGATANGYLVYNINGLNLEKCEIVAIDYALNQVKYPIVKGKAYESEYLGSVLKNVNISDAWVSGGIWLNRHQVADGLKVFIWDNSLTPLVK